MRIVRLIIVKLIGLFFIVFSLVLIFYEGKDYSILPAIDRLWDLIKFGIGLFLGIVLMRVNPELEAGVRQIVKFFALVSIGISLLLCLGHWSGIIFLVISCIIFWIFRDASVKKMFSDYVRDYDSGYAKTHPKLNKIRLLLSKILFGILILFLVILVGLILFTIICQT